MNWERFFLQKHKNIYVLHYCFHFWYSSDIFNANPWNINFYKFLFREKSRFLHRNCFYTSLYRIFMNIPGTYPLVKFYGGSENRICFCVKILWKKIQLPKHRKMTKINDFRVLLWLRSIVITFHRIFMGKPPVDS